MFSRTSITRSTGTYLEEINRLKEALDAADTVIIGAGAGLSTSAGFTYSGERFDRYFHDFAEKYRFRDMYAGGFYPYKSLNEHWAYWSRYIYINRYMDAPTPLYQELYELVKDRDYFVITTNVDHCFQKAGFDKDRLYYTQGDYGLFQCGKPCHNETYDNAEAVLEMVKAQGYRIGENHSYTPLRALAHVPINSLKDCFQPLYLPDGVTAKMSVPDELIPRCPKCGRPMTMNLRADDTFVQDSGWYQAASRYEAFLRQHENSHVLFLELGVGYNTPGIIKYSFWHLTQQWKNAGYACLNYGEAYAPDDIVEKSICINGDIRDILEKL